MNLLAGIAPQAESGQLPGISEKAEITGQDFAGIFAQVANGLVPQASALVLPINENSGNGEIVEQNILEPMSDGSANFENPELPVSPNLKPPVNIGAFEILEPVNSQLPASLKSKSPVNNETVDIVNQSNSDWSVDTFNAPLKEFDFVNPVKPEGKIQSPTANTPVVTVNGKAVPGVEKLPETNSPLFANDIIARLNLKEIHVKTEKIIENPFELVKNAILSQSISLKLEIDKSKKTATPKSFAAIAESSQNVIKIDNEPESGDNFSKNLTQAPVELKTEESKLLSAKMITGDKFETALANEKLVVQANIEQNANIDSKVWAITEPDQVATDIKTNPTVKLVLPEQAKLIGDARNHSMVIRIEPEHLGPAKLELHLKNEVLTARLTVETTAAKTTLENSINSLKEQFAKADIKVEQIEINVRGETNYNQMFDRQTQWHKFNQAHQQRFNAGDLLESFVPVNQINNFIQQQYVGSSGVNVLA